MTINVTYSIPGIIAVLGVVNTLNKNGELVIAQMLYHVEDYLDEVQPGGSIKLFCCRATFDRYLSLARHHAEGEVNQDQKPFRGVMKAISSQALRAIIEYCNLVKPGVIAEIKTKEREPEDTN